MSEEVSETEELQSESEDYLPKSETEEMPTNKFPSEPDWIYPKDFDIKANVSEMDNGFLMKYHDLTHIYWERILKGAELNYLLNELILLHYQIIREFEKRNLIHFEPINSLDSIRLSNIEYQTYIQNLEEKDEEVVEKSEANLSFSSPTISQNKL